MINIKAKTDEFYKYDKIRNKDNTYNKEKLWLIYLRNMHIIFFAFLAFIYINQSSWQTDGDPTGEEYLLTFVTVSEILIILFSILTKFTPKKRVRTKHTFNFRNKNEVIGFLLATLVCVLISFSYTTMMDFPSALLSLVFLFNGIFVFLSLIIHPLIIYLYEVNVFEKDQHSVLDFTFKYIAIFVSSINYYVQRELSELPFLLNKFLALIFAIIWMFHTLFFMGIFDS
ncbi:hypothetical protein N781_16140 [Pontibacillus halophilus JSM 076056 = DSM 19796]|uniref:Uncharacterized protein n=1 Tax=Pontibacillus halophilus JSM 076056 = DSM 19796 TaxID=1385510 RepID=A0A0A5G5X3_9BACI|nr:hypothetical protein N781_16140 [Pontibacillus halophilus JSM 076056 = DSM 19796]